MARSLGLTLVTVTLAAAALGGEGETPEFLPTPFSAEQIRDAWQPGFRVGMRTTEAGVATLQRITVVSATAEAATIREESFGASGDASVPPREATTKWEELRDHARLPAANATRERAECHSQLGAMPGWRYALRLANGDALVMCFADAAPGPPVEFESRRGEALVSRTEHTQYGRPSGAEEKP